MAKYRPIKTDFWDDDYIVSLALDEKLLYLCLITNPRTNLCGIYRVSIPYLYRISGIEQERIKDILNKFEADDKAKFINGEWISLKNVVKHHSRSPKITEGIIRELEEIPQDIAKMAYHIHRVGINLNLNLNSNLNSNLTFTSKEKQEKEKKYEIQNQLRQLARKKQLNSVSTEDFRF